jgi:hypothetical protein
MGWVKLTAGFNKRIFIWFFIGTLWAKVDLFQVKS